MNQDKEKQTIDRINELYRKKKASNLTEQEEEERKKLHQEFLKNFRASFKQNVEDMVIIDKDGKEVTSEKAKEAQRRKGLRKD
ncbi:DUF896 domain-containing protein [Lactobacillus sp. ESL0680]|uniref:DUF896 domain-containing protein n=1 Tax=Lactobacillus sp. ESL0680 TaxID=2983210 RepID=UPI0023F88285|nr:DUF896 domain-containing protein [Lactobacillus sp. ESL0680]WEV38083.1 DUF896 domain-containing protein [Lactobacillus sp. ESL0680]